MKANLFSISISRSCLCVLALLCLASCSRSGSTSSTSSSGNDAPSVSTTVAVVKADRQDLSKNVDITAEFMPWQSVDIHAEVTGYLKQINVDVGDHAKTGDVLAVLEVPELQDELRQANAEVQTATANVASAQAEYDESSIYASRMEGAGKETKGLVAQQDIDNADAQNRAAQAKLTAAKQTVAEKQASVQHLRDLVAYSKVIAPFDGVVTRRFADTGALIQAGGSGGGSQFPLVSFEQVNRLRLEFPVPESDVADIHVGAPVTISVSSLHKTFPGRISRFAEKVDMATRTMLTEVDVPNPDEKLTPGMYATVSVALATEQGALSIPIQSLSADDPPSVLTVEDDKVEKHTVTVGIKTPYLVEILSGLKEGDQVIVGNQSALQPGEEVNPKLQAKQSL